MCSPDNNIKSRPSLSKRGFCALARTRAQLAKGIKTMIRTLIQESRGKAETAGGDKIKFMHFDRF